MKKVTFTLLFLSLLVTACGQAATPTPTVLPSETPLPPTETSTPLPTETFTPVPTATPLFPVEGRGPSNFAEGVNPLTGLVVANAALLNRRPLAVKVENIPRQHRPQWGLSFADLVYEYYTEEGSTRFIALFYGTDAEMVAPIRSARFFDANIIRGYKAVFAFGSATEEVLNRLFSSEFANRLVLEGPSSPLKRYDPNGYNYLTVNTAELSAYATQKGLDNVRQNLDGMFFQLQAPAGGQPVNNIYVRFSAAIYNRWDYDAASGKYLRFSDTTDDLTNGLSETYAQLTDRQTNLPIATENMVTLYVYNEFYRQPPHEIMDIQFYGSGTGYAFRDGQAYKVLWQRSAQDSILTLTFEDGTIYPFKPGTTWFEIVGLNSMFTQNELGWRFVHHMP